MKSDKNRKEVNKICSGIIEKCLQKMVEGNPQRQKTHNNEKYKW